MPYDPKCDELAEYFLPKGCPPADKDELAQHTQDEIESWLVDNGYGPDEESENTGTES